MDNRDKHFRNLCYFGEYDKVIDWLKENSSIAKRSPFDDLREKFACECVNNSISNVVYGNVGAYSGTGLVYAIKCSGNPKKVFLTVVLP